jgi:hypothetical protein
VLRIKLFSTLPQISDSRPFATIEKFVGGLRGHFQMQIKRERSRIESRPRFADVAEG